MPLSRDGAHEPGKTPEPFFPGCGAAVHKMRHTVMGMNILWASISMIAA